MEYKQPDETQRGNGRRFFVTTRRARRYVIIPRPTLPRTEGFAIGSIGYLKPMLATALLLGLVGKVLAFLVLGPIVIVMLVIYILTTRRK